MELRPSDGGLHLQSKPTGQEPLIGREVADWETEIGRLYIRARNLMKPSAKKFMLKHNA